MEKYDTNPHKELEMKEAERDYESLKADLKRNSRGYQKLEEFKQQLYG